MEERADYKFMTPENKKQANGEKTEQSASRTLNSARNVATSIGGQLLNNILRFVCRTVFIYTLGKDYLGISSLYSNVLTLLSIAELGFGTAVTYSLYQPLADHDVEKVKSLMDFFRKAYQIIGLVIFGLGLLLMPFLPYLMTGVTDKVNIYLYYILYLLQTVVSYLFYAYKAVLLTADQKKYIVDIIQYIVQVCMNVVQIVILIVFRSFLAYTIIAIGFNIIQNLVTAKAADRRYPFLKEPAQRLSKKGRKTIFTQIYATFLYKISTAVGTATDNLIISTFIGTVMVGVYNNYLTIVTIFQNLISGVIQSFSASVGNLYATKGEDRSELVFRGINLANNLLIALISVLFLLILQPFIRLWIGKDWLLSNSVLIIIVYNFATNYMELVVNIYNEATGVFVKRKYRAVATAVVNLVVSIILVKKIGLAGVFLGSIISRLTTIWWYDAILLYRDAFHRSAWSYFLNYFLTCGLIAGLAGIIYEITRPFIGHDLILILVRGILAVVIVPAVYWLIYHKTEEYDIMMEKVRGLLRKIKRK